MKKTTLYLLVQIICFSYTANATNYYINALVGKNSNKGISQLSSWQTIAPLATIQLQAGDSVLLATGQQFTGMLSLINVKGSIQSAVVIGSYRYKGNKAKPVLDAGQQLNAILIQNCSYIHIEGIEITAVTPYQNSDQSKKSLMRCGILVEVTKDEAFENITLTDMVVHDVYYNAPGFTRAAAETQSANGTQSYGWGIRFTNITKGGQMINVQVLQTEIYNVSHTGLKFTATPNGIKQVIVANCTIHETGGPGMQASGVTGGHIHHNKINHSGATADSRNWGRGSGFWTWSCSNILIEHNRFENANGPGDSAGIHIDYNCSDVVVQYNFSANNAGGFCEILGNNYNCAYRYNISVNDGYRVKGNNGAFQEGKIFWLSGYQGNDKKKAGPYNSYFYNNSIYVASTITPKIAISSSASGVYIANNIFYFEAAAQMVAGDQKKKEVDADSISQVFFNNNLFLRSDNWPSQLSVHDATPIYGDAAFTNKGGLSVTDYLPKNKQLILNKGVTITQLAQDTIGLKIGLKVEKDILGNLITDQPDIGAIELLK